MTIDLVGHPGVFYRQLFRSLVHPSVGSDEVLKARHSSLIASHMLGGGLSAVAFAGYFLWTGAPGIAAIIALLCFLSQLAIALYLSKTGDLEVAHLFTAANLTAVITVAAVLSGGSASFAIAWLALVPLEAALSSDRRMMVIATGLALAALLGLHVATITGVIPPRMTLPVAGATLTLITHIGAICYAGGIAASIQQIHRSAARDVEMSREQYRLIAENTNDLITRHEATGGVTFGSLASHTLIGVSPDRLLGRGFIELLQPADQIRHAQSLTRSLAKGVPVAEEYKLQRQRADGNGSDTIWVEMRCQPVGADPNCEAGVAGSVIAVTRDISGRKAEAEALALARDEAERASRAKTAFLATMSHELRTPLSAIIGFSELLHRELLIKAREPKQADYCRIIHQSGEHLLSLVKDLLDVSKIESGKFSVLPEPLDLTEVAPASMDTLRPMAASKGVTLHCAIDADLPDVIADRRAVRQILINLVSNACKFTGCGGEVRLTATRRGDEIEIAVTDTGIGIAQEHIGKLGKPFYQVDTRYARDNEGAGLGLSIVRGLLELQNGRLTITSRLGEGSRFAVSLPADLACLDEAPVIGAAKPLKVIDLADIHRQAQRRDTEHAITLEPIKIAVNG